MDNFDNWIIDIFSHFPVQYALISLAVMIVCLKRKAIFTAVFAGLLMVLNISAIMNTGGSIQAAGHARSTFTVYSANINESNKDLSRLNKELRQISPDIVLLLEVTPAQAEQIRQVMKTYPYHVEETSIGSDNSGFVFFTKFPVLNHHVTLLSRRGNSLLEAMLDINKETVKFYGIHAQRPDIQNYSERRSQFLQLARQVNNDTIPVIIAGDFNATPFSHIFRNLLAMTGLEDTRSGYGWQPSWPAYFPLLWIPIDHILARSDVQVHRRSTGSFIGSDHYPVFAELSINSKK